MADGGELANAGEGERARRFFPLQQPRDVFAQQRRPAAARTARSADRTAAARRASAAAVFAHDRALRLARPFAASARRRNRRPTRDFPGRRRAWSHRPGCGPSRNCTQPALAKVLDDRVLRVADGRDDGMALDHALVFEHHPAGGHGGDARIQDHLHPALLERVLGVAPERFADLRAASAGRCGPAPRAAHRAGCGCTNSASAGRNRRAGRPFPRRSSRRRR